MPRAAPCVAPCTIIVVEPAGVPMITFVAAAAAADNHECNHGNDREHCDKRQKRRSLARPSKHTYKYAEQREAAQRRPHARPDHAYPLRTSHRRTLVTEPHPGRNFRPGAGGTYAPVPKRDVV